MNEIEDNVKVSWQLVSQFVSWEFCRFMCEQSEKENDNVQPDVLTYLRNMIVERTEKSASDVTKHEIVAKFVMETRTIQKASKMPCIKSLSETLIKMCPELEVHVTTLLPRLEGLLRVLECYEDADNKELVELSIIEAVNDFTKEACKILPLPDLPQVVEPWLHHGSQGEHPKDKYKCVINVELYQRAVSCLREEKIAPTEAKIIAELLYGDKELETLFQNFTDTETDVDSQQQDHSLPSSQPTLPSSQPSQPSSQPPLLSSLQQSLKLNNTSKSKDHTQMQLPPVLDSLSLDTPLPQPLPSETISKCPPHPVSPKNTLFDPNKLVLEEPLHSRLCDSSLDFEDEPAPTLKPGNSDSSPILKAIQRRNRRKYLEFIQYVEDLSDDENNRPTAADQRLSESPVGDLHFTFLNSQNRDDDVDTSDCDKNCEIRFLTPTMFKKDYVPPEHSKVVWLSDEESNGSTIVTMIDSQKNDSDFKTRARPSPVKKPLKAAVKRSKKVQLQSKKSPKTSRQATLRGFGFSSTTTPESPHVKANTARKRPFKLFDNDLMPKGHDESALFQKKEQKKKPRAKQKGEDLGNKRRCHDCKKTFRTPLELKKHVFIVHTMEDLSD